MLTPTFNCPYCRNPVACTPPTATDDTLRAKCAACGGTLKLQLRVLKAGVPKARTALLKVGKALVGEDVRLKQSQKSGWNGPLYPAGTILRCRATEHGYVFLANAAGQHVLKCRIAEVELHTPETAPGLLPGEKIDFGKVKL